jgi:hypothetical protein
MVKAIRLIEKIKNKEEKTRRKERKEEGIRGRGKEFGARTLFCPTYFFILSFLNFNTSLMHLKDSICLRFLNFII